MPDVFFPQEPPEQVGSYRILERLGEGGMGTVFLAFDSVLGRRVALKWLKQATPATIERLRQEAHLHARVEHPAVCRLYQVDEWQGCPFLVLQYIQGTTLDQIASQLSMAAKLRIFAALADAVHAAHRQGLIHRDLKPSNLMVEADGAGGWHPYVMDFGLARDEAEGTLTNAGTLLGSPAYMAPEQALAGWVDVRTDVYGLGAAFFEVLTGRPPFLGKVAELLVQVQSEEAPRLRTLLPDASRDLETVVATCLAKDPARRYPSAAALRDDLMCLLDDSPIKARQISPMERMGLWIRRNRLASALIALVALAVLGAGVGYDIQQRRAQTRAYWAERFGREALHMENILQFGRMLPAHDIARELGWVRQQMDHIRNEMRRNPQSRGAGHFVLAQGELMLGDAEAARRDLEQAWTLGHRSPESALALGLSLVQQYEDEIPKAESILDSKAREAKKAELKRNMLDRGHSLLAQARKERGGLFPLVAEVRLAIAEDRLDEAARLAQASVEAEPWNGRALFYLAKALAYRGRKEAQSGRINDAKADYERVLDLMDTAVRLGPSDDTNQDVLKFVWEMGSGLQLRGLDTRASLERSLAASEAMMRLNSERTDMLNNHARILGRLGREVAQHGGDPEPYFLRAEAVMRKVVDAPIRGCGSYPERVRIQAIERLASIAHMRAGHAITRNQDPSSLIQAGLSICHQGIAEGHAQWETYMIMGLLWLDQANAQEKRHQENVDALEQAAQGFRVCAQLNPELSSWTNLAEVLGMVAKRRLERGEDPMKPCVEARSAIQQALAIYPKNPDVLESQKTLESLEARWQARGTKR